MIVNQTVENHDDLLERVDSPDLDIDENCVMVLKNGGPHGGPGMPELGNMPVPAKLIKKGITDILRISDARMSGTSYGACILHVAPESFVGGPLALVQDGDVIELDVSERRLSLKVSDEELARRRAEWKQPPSHFSRGWGALYSRHVQQADKGCDFDFLEGTAPTPEPEIH